MDCFHQTNKPKKFCTVLQKPKRSHGRKNQMRSQKKNQSVLHFPLVTPRRAYLSLTSKQCSEERTANRTDPVQAGDEHSTQKSAKYMDDKFKMKKKTKIKLHKIFCEYIYNCRFFFFF